MHAMCGIYMYIHVYVCIHTPSISCGEERQVEVLHSLIDQVAHGMFGVVKIIMKSPVFVKCRAAVFRNVGVSWAYALVMTNIAIEHGHL